MKIGDVVKIKKCEPLPELVGENAKILRVKMLVKITSGRSRGKIHVLQDGEVEELPKDTVEAERFTNEVARGVVEQSLGFWEGKTPCWETTHCPEAIMIECPAFWYRFLPCWEIDRTYCKLDYYGTLDLGITICELCSVYKRYG